MPKQYKYRMYCETDSKYECITQEAVPTACPTNWAHTITAWSVTIIENVIVPQKNLYLESPDGTVYEVTVSNAWALSATAT